MKIKKEATVAVIIGLLIALLVTGGVIRARSALSQVAINSRDLLKREHAQTPESSPTPLFLELTTQDNSIATSPQQTISGKTLPGTYIAILGELGEYLIVPTDVGNFSQEIALAAGANLIRVTVYQADGAKIEKSLTVVYTSAKL